MARSKLETAAYALISDYISLYKEKYGTSPIINKYKEKWAMMSMVEDFSTEEVMETLNYYFKLSKDGHPITYFYNNFASIHKGRLSSERDAKIRADQRKMTQKLRAEYINVL